MAREMRREGFMAADIDPAILDDSFAGGVEKDLANLSGDFFSRLEHGAEFRERAGKTMKSAWSYGRTK